MKYFLICLFTLLVAACDGGPYADYVNEGAGEAVDTRAAAAPEGQPYDEVDTSAAKKMVREGTMEMRSSDVHAVKNYLDGQLKKYGGYYSVVNYAGEQGTSEPGTYRLEAKVPSAAFDDFISAISMSGSAIEKVSVSAVDVTDRYIDYEIRLASQKSYLERYRQLLGRLNTVKEIIELQERIRLLETEIESTEARFRELAGRIQYSTLEIVIRPAESHTAAAHRPGFFTKAGDALAYGWDWLKTFVVVMLYLWPLWLAGAVVLYVIVFKRRQRRRDASR